MNNLLSGLIDAILGGVATAFGQYYFTKIYKSNRKEKHFEFSQEP